jgi:protein-disulfide isomerase
MGNARQAKSTREKAAQLRQDAERARMRQRNVVVAISTVAVVALIVGLTVLVRTLSAQQAAKEAAASAPPKNVYSDASGATGYLYGKDTAKVTVVAYEDFICPACKNFETLNTKTLRDYADAGKIKIIYHPVAILDNNATTPYSTRAASAVAAVMDVAPDKFIAYHDALFTGQPEEGGPGLSDAQLIDIAVQAGVTKTQVEAAINTRKFGGWVKKMSDDFTKKYQPSTPTIVVNGQQLKSYAPDVVKAAVDKAIAG